MLRANVNSKKTLRPYLCCSPSQALARAGDSSKGCPNTNHSGSPPSQEPAALEMSKLRKDHETKDSQSMENKHAIWRRTASGKRRQKLGRCLPFTHSEDACFSSRQQAWHSKLSTAHFFPSPLASLSN